MSAGTGAGTGTGTTTTAPAVRRGGKREKPEVRRAMIVESERVARLGYLHTTPNRWFPIEPHLMIPLLRWLPERARQRAFSAVGFDGYTREHYWLFSARTLRRLGTRASRCTGGLARDDDPRALRTPGRLPRHCEGGTRVSRHAG